MKRTAFALALTFALLLGACGGAAPEQTAKTVQEPASFAVTEEAPAKAEEPIPVITTNITRADVEAIPIADASMTEEELREICVRYMKLEKEVMWVVNKNVAYPCDWAGAADVNGNLHLTRGVLYRGMPYTGAHLNLECFFDVVDEATGLFDTESLVSGSGVSAIIGNTCNTSCFWAWQRVCASFSFVSLAKMTPVNHCIPIGPYKTTEESFFGEDHDTPAVCLFNGEQTMYESYAMLKPASGMLTKSDSNVGHVRMAQEAAVTVRNADGTIDGDQSYVICLEQTSALKPCTTENGPASAYKGMDVKYTFRQLFQSHYLPFDFAELLGLAEVQKAKTELTGDDPGDFAALAAEAVTSNYGISRVDVTVTDAAGRELYTYGVMNSIKNSGFNRVELSRVFQSRQMRSAGMEKGETYRFTVTARLANGETFTAFDGELAF